MSGETVIYRASPHNTQARSGFRVITAEGTMELAFLRPEEVPAPLAALRAVASANRSVTAPERTLLDLIAEMHGSAYDPMLPDVSAAEVASIVTDRQTFETHQGRTVDVAGLEEPCRGRSHARRPARVTSNFTVLCSR